MDTSVLLRFLGPGTGFVYGLRVPGESGVRYVGQTTLPLETRLRNHLYEARDTKSASYQSYKNRWLRTLAATEVTPEIVLLETLPTAGLDSAEQDWIGWLGSRCQLTNANVGGGSNRGWKMTPEQRSRLSVSQKAYWANPVALAHRRAVSHGVPPVMVGENNPFAKLTAETVTWARRQVRAGSDYGSLASELGVTVPTLWAAVTGRTWKCLSAPPVVSRSRNRLTDSDVAMIRNQAAAGVSWTELAHQVGTTRKYIGEIVNQRRRAV